MVLIKFIGYHLLLFRHRTLSTFLHFALSLSLLLHNYVAYFTSMFKNLGKYLKY